MGLAHAATAECNASLPSVASSTYIRIAGGSAAATIPCHCYQSASRDGQGDSGSAQDRMIQAVHAPIVTMVETVL